MFIFCHSCVVFLALLALQPLRTSASEEQCDTRCPDKPIFTPSEVVVKFGHSLSTTCTVCESACLGSQFDVEKAIGENRRNESAATVAWTVEQVTEWDTSALCFYNDQHQEDHQCCTELHATVYQPPSQVSIGLVGHSGPMLEGQRYTLQCAVQQAAPVDKVLVVFYKEQTPLASVKFNGTRGLKTPQDENFTLDFRPSREDNGVALWCKVILDLEVPEGRPEVTSTSMTAVVHYEPTVDTLPVGVVSVSVGDPLNLSCRAEGNPAPTYQWSHRSHRGPASYSAHFTLSSATSSDGGQYTCWASNSVGNATVTFQVEVKVNYIPFVIGAICASLLVLVIIIYMRYRKNRMGKYDFLNFSLGKPASQQKSSV